MFHDGARLSLVWIGPVAVAYGKVRRGVAALRHFDSWSEAEAFGVEDIVGFGFWCHPYFEALFHPVKFTHIRVLFEVSRGVLGGGWFHVKDGFVCRYCTVPYSAVEGRQMDVRCTYTTAGMYEYGRIL